MDAPSFYSLVLFCTVATATPGPNNLMLMASGLNYGFKKTFKHILGITFGFTFMMGLVGLGIGPLIQSNLYIKYGLVSLSLLMVTYLAFRIATATPLKENNSESKPIGFFTAAFFQWVNPKAWAVGLTTVSVYSKSGTLKEALIIAIVFGSVTLPVTVIWTLAGQKLRRLLQSPTAFRFFNITMALLMVSSVVFGLMY